MKQPIRYLSIGLFTAALIMLVAFYFTEPKRSAENVEIEEMITNIEAEGYHVVTQAEYITLAVANDNNEAANEEEEKEDEEDQDTDETNDDQDEENEEEQEEEIETYTLVIEANMVPSTVSDLLVENNIIDDANEFNQFMEENGYSPLIQIGEHNVSSDMTKEELAEELMKFN